MPDPRPDARPSENRDAHADRLTAAEKELRTVEIYAAVVANRLELARLGHETSRAGTGCVSLATLTDAELAATGLTRRLRNVLTELEPTLIGNADAVADLARRRVDTPVRGL